MVCKECGAYNAENLTHCRVCSAVLKESDMTEPVSVQESGRPARNFAQAPKWPTRAFAGATTQPLQAPAAAEATPAAEEPSRPVVPAAAPVQNPVQKPVQKDLNAEVKVCPACGKPLVSDAPFCAYCGTRVSAQPDAAEEPVRPAKRPAAVSSKPIVEDEEIEEFESFDDDDLEEEDFDYEDDFDDLYEEDDDDFDDDLYDDEFDDDDEDFDMPRKKGKGGTILFVVLVVVLVALIAVFGGYVLKKNYGGSFSNMIASLTGKSQPDTEQTEDTQGGSILSNTTTAVTADNMSATIEETIADNVEMFVINVSAPTGSTVRIISNAELATDSVQIQSDDAISLRVPRVVFLPGGYYDSTTVTVTPQLEITLPDGTTKMLSVPSATATVPQVSLVVAEPATNPVEATADGSPIKVSGTVTDHTVEVTVNGQSVQVLEGGVFSYDYTPTSDTEQYIDIVAQKDNCMSAKQSIIVTPYVVKDMSVSVTNEVKTLTAADGIVTVEGSVPAGAAVTAICENENIVCGPVTVSADGKFTCIVEVKKEGCYEINFAATAEGYKDGAVSCIVERAPATDSEAYRKKALNTNKYFTDLVEGKKDDTQLAFTGTIKEIVTTGDYVVFTIEDSAGNRVYACNRSAKSTIDTSDIGDKKRVAGYNAGLYPETTSPYIWAWFIWNL